MTILPFSSPPVLPGLRRRWLLFMLFCLAFSASGYGFLASVWKADYALRWALITLACLAYLSIVLGRNLEANHRAGESELLPTLGHGNHLTLLRGVMTAGMAGFLFSPQPAGALAWAPGVLYTLACIADYFDGTLARRANHATRLGEVLDMSFDGLGVLAAAILTVQYGQAPAWYLSIALARYLFVGGLWLVRRSGRPVYPLPPSISRRALAGVQMGFMAVLLWPLFAPPATQIAAALFALPFLAGFIKDFLIASGVLRAVPGKVKPGWQAFTSFLPLGLRLLVLFLAAAPVSHRFLNYDSEVSFYLAAGLPFPEVSVLALGLLEGAVVLLVLTGSAGRTAAILGLGLLGLSQLWSSLSASQVLLVAAYTAILFLGTGNFSLWTPEDRLIYRHLPGASRGA